MAYKDKYGVEFSDDQKTLIRCPKDFKGAYVIPDSVTMIGGGAFYGCTGLTSIEIPNSVTKIGSYTFEDCMCLISIKIPNSVTTIEYKAFAGCCALTLITIPNSVTTIEYEVFKGCIGLTSITIPAMVQKISNHILDNTNIKEIHIRHTNPEQIDVAENAFDECAEHCTLYVPIGTGYAYRHHPVFGKFKEVIIEK